MSKLGVFNAVSMDGYFTDANGDMSWAHIGSHNGKNDPEWDAFTAGNARGGGRLLFGRITYELMIRYWPTPVAMQQNPAVAEHMNKLPKVVFSRTVDKASWTNTRLVKSNIVEEVRKMKQEPGDDMVILGSGSIVSQLADAGLIDEYQIVVVPLILGQGRTLFEGVGKKLNLKLTQSRAFANGKVVLSYELAS
jgi:dihydrofolate reductase